MEPSTSFCTNLAIPRLVRLCTTLTGPSEASAAGVEDDAAPKTETAAADTAARVARRREGEEEVSSGVEEATHA
jgi:IS5 family transposase